VNQVIGSAIFILPADVARLVGAWSWIAFIAVGLLSLSIALCFAEVGSRFAKTGGPYLPAREAFGRFVGFEVGWMMWFARVTSQSSVANALAIALSFYWADLAAGLPRAALLTVLTIAVTWINVRGVRQSSWVVNGLTIGKLAPLAIFMLVGAWYMDPSRLTTLPPVSRDNAAAAAILLIFAYGGYEVTGVLAGEARDPRRDVPFAFVAVLITVAVVMSFTTIVATGVLPDIAATKTPLADGAQMFLGAAGALMISIGSAVSMTGNNMGQILNGSRTLFALAENRDLPRWFARVHPRFQTPSNSILFTAAVALTLALTGSFATLAAVSAIARLVMYLAVCIATLVLRRRAASGDLGEAKFVVPLGPVVPILASLVALIILAGASTQQLIAGVAALAAGVVFFMTARLTTL
jgi:amino acid transporter